MSPRRKKHKPAVQGNIIEIMHDLPEGTSLRELEDAVTSGRLPTDREEIRRLSMVCRYCGVLGHWHKDCPENPCYLCGKPGHRRSRCPQREAT